MEIGIILLLLFAAVILKIKRSAYSHEKERKKCESPIEAIMFDKLHQEGFKPYTQVSCGKFRIDIAVYYGGKKVAIECDGEKFHSSPEQKEHDRRKDVFLEKNRWKVYRFTGKEIYNNADWCVNVIKKNKKRS